MSGPRSESTRPYRLIVADAGGSITRLLEQNAEELQTNIAAFTQPELAADDAVTHGGDLIIMAEPRILDPLERLRNDPRTRHIPLILLSSRLNDAEKRFAALCHADQVLDHPIENELLIEWAGRGLRGQLERGNLLDYALARMNEAGESYWTGRVCWVSDHRLRFETDIVPEVGSIFPVAGPLMKAMGMQTCPTTVLTVSESDVFYNYGARLELEIPENIRVSLREFCEKEGRCIARRKIKLGILCESGCGLARVASLLDSTRYAIRWIKSAVGIAASLKHLNPALLLVDPKHSDLADPVRAAALVRLPEGGIPILPLSTPDNERLWTRLGSRCPTSEVPDAEDAEAWAKLLGELLGDELTTQKQGRAYLRRDHLFSHLRMTIPCALNELSEAGGGVRTMCKVLTNARARFDIPALTDAGLQSLHGRALSGEKAEEKIKVVWMGIGGDREATRLRRFVSERIMAARREEYNATDD